MLKSYNYYAKHFTLYCHHLILKKIQKTKTPTQPQFGLGLYRLRFAFSQTRERERESLGCINSICAKDHKIVSHRNTELPRQDTALHSTSGPIAENIISALLYPEEVEGKREDEEDEEAETE